MNDERYKNYLTEIVDVLIEQAMDSKNEERNNLDDLAYWQGHSMAYYSILSLLQEQAEFFNIRFDSIGLDKINPDKDLLDFTFHSKNNVVTRKNKPKDDSKR